ncbi:hypothetical protein BC938DRAFT_473799 [Jimgerdemannia flammicorona]|uniref:Uncharacterized protein n=1 Tax=Jimgerdemannia flammicorona TaxID=994334 RepID=A0A433Q3E1_9FUNG|nr:hypothetical protein BC938DRAFT_473799 [Jimgerdemannia flammicorona]
MYLRVYGHTPPFPMTIIADDGISTWGYFYCWDDLVQMVMGGLEFETDRNEDEITDCGEEDREEENCEEEVLMEGTVVVEIVARKLPFPFLPPDPKSPPPNTPKPKRLKYPPELFKPPPVGVWPHSPMNVWVNAPRDRLESRATLLCIKTCFDDTFYVAPTWLSEHYFIKYKRLLIWETQREDWLIANLPILCPDISIQRVPWKGRRPEYTYFVKLASKRAAKINRHNHNSTYATLRHRVLRLASPWFFSVPILSSMLAYLYKVMYGPINWKLSPISCPDGTVLSGWTGFWKTLQAANEFACPSVRCEKVEGGSVEYLIEQAIPNGEDAEGLEGPPDPERNIASFLPSSREFAPQDRLEEEETRVRVRQCFEDTIYVALEWLGEHYWRKYGRVLACMELEDGELVSSYIYFVIGGLLTDRLLSLVSRHFGRAIRVVTVHFRGCRYYLTMKPVMPAHKCPNMSQPAVNYRVFRRRVLRLASPAPHSQDVLRSCIEILYDRTFDYTPWEHPSGAVVTADSKRITSWRQWWMEEGGPAEGILVEGLEVDEDTVEKGGGVESDLIRWAGSKVEKYEKGEKENERGMIGNGLWKRSRKAREIKTKGQSAADEPGDFRLNCTKDEDEWMTDASSDFNEEYDIGLMADVSNDGDETDTGVRNIEWEFDDSSLLVCDDACSARVCDVPLLDGISSIGAPVITSRSEGRAWDISEIEANNGNLARPNSRSASNSSPNDTQADPSYLPPLPSLPGRSSQRNLMNRPPPILPVGSVETISSLVGPTLRQPGDPTIISAANSPCPVTVLSTKNRKTVTWAVAAGMLPTRSTKSRKVFNQPTTESDGLGRKRRWRISKKMAKMEELQAQLQAQPQLMSSDIVYEWLGSQVPYFNQAMAGELGPLRPF